MYFIKAQPLFIPLDCLVDAVTQTFRFVSHCYVSSYIVLDCVVFQDFFVVANARGSRGTNQGVTDELGTATGRCLTNWVHTQSATDN